MRQEKQFQSAKTSGEKQKNLSGNSRKRQVHINFHNPNTEEDTVRFLINLVMDYLEEGAFE
jgi:hypothetical protein